MYKKNRVLSFILNQWGWLKCYRLISSLCLCLHAKVWTQTNKLTLPAKISLCECFLNLWLSLLWFSYLFFNTKQNVFSTPLLSLYVLVQSMMMLMHKKNLVTVVVSTEYGKCRFEHCLLSEKAESKVA